MKRKLYEAVALLIALAMLAGLALSEGMLEAPDMGLDIEDAEILEFDEMASPDVVDEVPDDIELSLGALDLKGNVTYKSFTGAAGSYILVLTDVVNPVLPEDSARDSFLNNQIYNFRYGEDNQIVIDSSRAESDIEYNQNREFLKSQEDLNNG